MNVEWCHRTWLHPGLIVQFYFFPSFLRRKSRGLLSFRITFLLMHLFVRHFNNMKYFSGTWDHVNTFIGQWPRAATTEGAGKNRRWERKIARFRCPANGRWCDLNTKGEISRGWYWNKTVSVKSGLATRRGIDNVSVGSWHKSLSTSVWVKQQCTKSLASLTFRWFTRRDKVAMSFGNSGSRSFSISPFCWHEIAS